MPALYNDVEPVRICGYASVFNVLYELAGTLERIAPGAFNLERVTKPAVALTGQGLRGRSVGFFAQGAQASPAARGSGRAENPSP